MLRYYSLGALDSLYNCIDRCYHKKVLSTNQILYHKLDHRFAYNRDIARAKRSPFRRDAEIPWEGEPL
jgi:hypothetical protein